MTIAERLELQAAREAALIEKLNARFARELREVLKFANAQVREVLRDLHVSPFDSTAIVERARRGRSFAGSKARLGRLLGLRRDIQAALRQAGYEALMQSAVDTPLDDIADLVLRGQSIANQAAAFSRLDPAVLTALKTVRFEELLGVGEMTALRLQRIALDGMLGLQDVEELVDDVADEFEVTERQARSLYDTSLSIYSRQVDQLHATGEPDELFYYAGPLDTKTRKFCLERVGKVLTRKELEEADNGQLPNPLLTGGGYNCRHQPKRVSQLDEELLALAGTGKRVAHVQQALDEFEPVYGGKAA